MKGLSLLSEWDHCFTDNMYKSIFSYYNKIETIPLNGACRLENSLVNQNLDFFKFNFL